MSQPQDLFENARPYLQSALKGTRDLPLFTLGITAAMSLFFLLSLVTPILSNFSLKPSDIPNFELSRLTTYPLIHASMLQFIISVGTFVPLCSRFEKKYGTLRSLAMFLGPFESVPGLLYCLVDGVFLRQDSAIVGCSGFVFTMISIEALQYRSKSSEVFIFAGRRVPVYTVPFFGLALTTLLLPNSSLLLHLAAIGMGFVFGSGRVDFLLLPLRVVNFIETRADVIFSKVPNYITAERATKDFPTLPTDEPSGYSRTSAGLPENAEGIPLQRISSTNTTTAAQAAASAPNLSPNNARPSVVRQTSSKWTSSQRED